MILRELLTCSRLLLQKMIQKLSEMKLIKYEKYGVIIMEQEGKALGKALLYRHNLIEEFLKLLNIKEGLLTETENRTHHK